jgi:hypothetical protein
VSCVSALDRVVVAATFRIDSGRRELILRRVPALVIAVVITFGLGKFGAQLLVPHRRAWRAAASTDAIDIGRWSTVLGNSVDPVAELAHPRLAFGIA